MWLAVAVLLAAARSQVAPEPYRAFVARSLVAPDAALAAALDGIGDPAVASADVEPLIAANCAFLDAAFAPHGVPSPSLDASLAVPLLVNAVRDWAAEGAPQRAQCYDPIVDALRRPSLRPAPRILVPGSGLGRLAYELAAAFPGSEVVAVDPDVAAQVLAGHMMSPPPASPRRACVEAGGLAGCADEAASEDGPVAEATAATIHPGLHVLTSWARTADRLRGVRVPDVPAAELRRVAATSNVSLVVGGFPEAEADEGVAGPPGAGYDAAATSFFLDVASNLSATAAALRRLLLPRRGVWANLGPLAYPEDYARVQGGAGRAYPLSGAQVMGLVRRAGFDVQRQAEVDCEYTELPARLETTRRRCLFFVALPAADGDAADDAAEPALSHSRGPLGSGARGREARPG